jgi:hypothetical protein
LEQSSRIFQIFAASRLTENTFTSLELSFAEDPDVDSLLASRTQLISETDRAARIQLVDIWLVTRCGGLIEANNSSESNGLNRNLSYLHRTVRDFLEVPQVWSRILGPTRESDFNPYVSLLQSGVLFLKFVLLPTAQPRIRFVEGTLYYAYQAEFETRRAEVFLLDELDQVMQRSNGSLYFWGATEEFTGQNPQHDFLALAIRCGLYHYVAHKIESQPDIVGKREGCPLLRYAVRREIGLIGDRRLSSRIVELLLHNGSRPNQIYDGDSAWDLIQRRLETLIFTLSQSKRDNSRSKIEKDHESSELLKVTRIFLLNGAIVNEPAYDKILWDLGSEFPDEAKELRDLAVGRTRGSGKSDVDLIEESQNNQASGRRKTTTKSCPTLSDDLCGKGGPYSTEDGRLNIAAPRLPQRRRRKWLRKLYHLTTSTSLKPN